MNGDSWGPRRVSSKGGDQLQKPLDNYCVPHSRGLVSQWTPFRPLFEKASFSIFIHPVFVGLPIDATSTGHFRESLGCSFLLAGSVVETGWHQIIMTKSLLCVSVWDLDLEFSSDLIYQHCYWREHLVWLFTLNFPDDSFAFLIPS